MATSVFEIFKVGIGPSSSHTVGPMRAASTFVEELRKLSLLEDVTRITVDLLGSLGATGRGHASDRAVILGLEGAHPATVDPTELVTRVEEISSTGELLLGRLSGSAVHRIHFDLNLDLILHHTKRSPHHPNAATFTAFHGTTAIHEATYYSIGGGFIVRDDGAGLPSAAKKPITDVPYPFTTATDLIRVCSRNSITIAQAQFANECSRSDEESVGKGLSRIWQVMDECIALGCSTSGTLPGGLNVRRRAAGMTERLARAVKNRPDPLGILDWVTVWALAVNEQNAAGGRVVTAPTNGAAGILPAALKYALNYCECDSRRVVEDFLLTAGAIGAVFQLTGSISGAEVGCQGEVGVASSMAAAGLCAVLGGTTQQVCNAAEIGMEHHLGLTCDPIGGLVQVPCIERNAIGAVTAITAARLALAGDGNQIVSLDQVIETMMATGADMKTKYKETSRGGLAVSVVEC